MNKQMIRQHITFYGNVQGVGFRYRAQHAANYLGVTGWIRNEWDGSVKMEVQGTQEQIDQLIFMIQQGTYITIETICVEQLPLEEERSFCVHGY